jgi:ADP-ribosylglycohydrolase
MTAHPLYAIALADLETDIVQMGEEGHEVAALREECARVAAGHSLEALLALQQELWSRPSPAGFPYEEPNGWETISRGFPAAGDPPPAPSDLADRLHGGWLGRAVGCQVGKPLEGAWPEQVKEVLTAIGSWPLSGYMNPISEGEYQRLAASPTFRRYYQRGLVRGAFSHAAPDDDLHYAVTSQIVLERYGADFAPGEAVGVLLELTPVSCLYAAGRHLFRMTDFGVTPPEAARYGNPCRQSLGGQIRCDAFGWAAPGRPHLAAWMAYKDAANSQTRNGIYSAIFFAVLLAEVLAHRDVTRAISRAQAYVPPRSRFAEMVRFTIEACGEQVDWEAVNRAIYLRYDAGNPRPESLRINHALPNAALVIMALLKGGGSFADTVGLAAMAGMDTDCNAATAGSIMGCARGTGGVPAELTEPLHDTIRTQLKDLPEVRISELAGRMHEVARRNLEDASGRT